MTNYTNIKVSQIIWDYMKLNIKPTISDIIIVLGSHDTQVPLVTADLFKHNFAPLIIVSGGLGSITKTTQTKTEAETFAEILIANGVPKDKIILESKSSNTGDNFIFTKKLVEEMNINSSKALVVTKPYMERRVFATGKKVWPELDIIPVSENILLKDYIQLSPLGEKMIDILVGDLQRIDLYGKNGFQIPQDIPEEVMLAFNELVKRGFDSRLLK